LEVSSHLVLLVSIVVYNNGMIFLSLNNNNVSSEFQKLRLFCIVSQFNLAKPTQKATRQSGAWTPDDAIGPSMTQFPIFFGSVFGDAFGLHPININIGLSNPIDIFLSFCLYFLFSLCPCLLQTKSAALQASRWSFMCSRLPCRP